MDAMGSRWEKQNQKGRRGKSFVFGISMTLLAFVLCGGIYWYGRVGESQNAFLGTTKGKEYDRVEGTAVFNQEKMAGSFMDQGYPSAEPGDNRTPIRIIEVIPHEVCSLFPYLVEWGDKKGYDKNVPIGYEGLMYLASSTQLANGMFHSTSTERKITPYSRKEAQAGISGQHFLNLTDGQYQNPIGTKQQLGAWFRLTDPALSSNPVSGYFEYVGNFSPAKGMFHIIAGSPDANGKVSGVQHQTQILSRKGSEAPKGELYVKSPAYYWAKEHANRAYPDFNTPTGGVAVESRSGNNYTLEFGLNPLTGTYKADTDNRSYQATGGTDFDYMIVADQPENWETGFGYQENGNYVVADAQKDTTSPNPEQAGLYVRIQGSFQDGYEDTQKGIAKGYFRRYINSTDSGAPAYSVKFQATASTVKGAYCANPPEDWNDTTGPGYSFDYRGAGKGTYSVPFLYAGVSATTTTTEKRYSPKVIEVTEGGGRYALTSLEVAVDGKAPYDSIENDPATYPKDYAKIITNLAFTDDTNAAAGVMLGGRDNAPGGEKGNWVFHTLTNAGERQLTKLSEVAGNTTFAPGQRIYVTGQKIRHRSYCRNEFVNNEWFKLLCYSNHPADPTKSYIENINGVGYDMNKTGVENLEAAKTIISGFDSKYRVEIQQVSFQNLTPDMVEQADLLYISKAIAIRGIDANAWNAMSLHRQTFGEEPLAPLPGINGNALSSTQGDIRLDTMFAIYDRCVTKRELGVIMDDSLRKADSYVENNITKLYYLLNYFVEAQNFAYFMPDMYPLKYNDKYTKIRGTDHSVNTTATSTLDVYQTIWSDGGDGISGMYNYVFKDTSNTEYGRTRWYLWSLPIPYFVVVENANDKEKVDKAAYKWRTQYDSSFFAKVIDGETKMVLGDSDMTTSFYSALTNGHVWKLFNNNMGNKDNYTLQVVPVNGEKIEKSDGSIQWAIYGNEMDPTSFQITYQVTLDGTVQTIPTLVKAEYQFVPESGGGAIPLPGDPVAALNGEYTVDAKDGFGSPIDYKTHKGTVTITVTDSNGKTGSVQVVVILRESFDLT